MFIEFFRSIFGVNSWKKIIIRASKKKTIEKEMNTVCFFPPQTIKHKTKQKQTLNTGLNKIEEKWKAHRDKQNTRQNKTQDIRQKMRCT